MSLILNSMHFYIYLLDSGTDLCWSHIETSDDHKFCLTLNLIELAYFEANIFSPQVSLISI